uniref:Tumor protein D52 n=1 Tax=Meloidogyne incognita TaxID=6306 RepID=A0A914L5N4_MELIC
MATPGIEASHDPAANSVDGQLTEAERELILEELKKTEDEVATLRQVLAVRQKQVAHLKHKLGISPFNELTSEMAQGIRTVKETPAPLDQGFNPVRWVHECPKTFKKSRSLGWAIFKKLSITKSDGISTQSQNLTSNIKPKPHSTIFRFQKTSEFVGGTAETVANKFNDIRKSSFFKSFETKIGSAVNNAKMVASTSIDHLANVAGGGARTPQETGESKVVGSPPPPPLS